jgi:hypothetical protein
MVPFANPSTGAVWNCTIIEICPTPMDLGTVQHNLDRYLRHLQYCSGGRSISVEELHDLQCRGQRLLVAQRTTVNGSKIGIGKLK